MLGIPGLFERAEDGLVDEPLFRFPSDIDRSF
jgi:hypothetical protein